MRKSRLVIMFLLSSAIILKTFSFSFAASHSRYWDETGILSDVQAGELTKILDEISERHDFDIVVGIISGLDERTAHVYALDAFLELGFGVGNERDGAILLIAVDDRKFGFAASGRGIDIFNPQVQEYIDKLYVPHLRENEFFEAATVFADGCDDILSAAESGKPYRGNNLPQTDEERSEDIKTAVIASLIISLIVAAVINGVWIAQLKSVRRKDFAHMYIREGSMSLTESRDIFLTRRVTKMRRAKSQSGGGRGGGIGGGFSSSSGHSGTGHSGKF